MKEQNKNKSVIMQLIHGEALEEMDKLIAKDRILNTPL